MSTCTCIHIVLIQKNLAAKLWALICLWMKFYTHGHISNMPTHSEHYSMLSDDWQTIEALWEKKKGALSPPIISVIANKEVPGSIVKHHVSLWPLLLVAHSPFTGLGFPLSKEAFIFWFSSNKLFLINMLEDNSLVLSEVYTLKVHTLFNNEHIFYFRYSTIL